MNSRHCLRARRAIFPALSAISRALRPGAALVVVLWLMAAPAQAQDAQVQALMDRIDRLQRELVTLQRQVYRGEPPPAAAEIAAEPTVTKVEGLTTEAAARIELRLSQLEAQLRGLTGQIEEAGYRQSQLRGQIDRLASDMDTRVRRLEQAGVPMAGAAPAPALGPAPGSAQGQLAAPGASSPLGDTSPKVLGTVDAADLAALRSEKVEPASPAAAAPDAAAPSTTVALQGTTPKEQYDYAFGLLRQANYGGAEGALRAFIEAYPNDPLAGNAKYWLGETYYVRQDYQQAAITFAEAYQQYPDNAKAPDNLLKLGMSLSSLGSKADACGTFAELLKRYAAAAATVRQRAKRERQRLACP
ncbi:MAG: tol-pal system protein YbgF [Kiloniellaceae bacterium]